MYGKRSACGVVADQVGWLKPTVTGSRPLGDQTMGRSEPGGEDEHGEQDHPEQEQGPQSFHRVVLSCVIVAGPCKNRRPNSVLRAQVTSAGSYMIRAVPGR